jgi:hypothetical protein
MINTTIKKALIMLQDGSIFWGRSVGLDGEATGEICFNTGMTGYQEIFTDPSYFGQIMVTTTAHIGNYGAKDDEVESDSIKIAGLVCRNFSNFHSRYGASESLFDFFRRQNKVVISEVDTRALVRHIRDKGAMNAIISTETDDLDALRQKLSKVPSMEGLELSSRVTTREPYFFGEKAAEKEKARQEEERAKQERAAQKEQAEKQEAAKKERLRQEQEKAEQELAAQQAEAKRRAAIEKERLRQEKAAQEALAEERAAEKAKRKKDKATRKALEEQREDVERMATRKGGKAN